MLTSPVPIPNTPSNLLPAATQRTSQTHEKDDGGPFRAEMVHRMESLAKGERILPPCDRCRRLHMDCLKNLTACMGCTKKHAKCSWKEVRESELHGSFSRHLQVRGAGSEGEEVESHDQASTASPRETVSPSNPSTGPGGPPNAFPTDARIIPNRLSPPGHERERDRGMEAQLQEAARSGLAHARLGAADGKATDYQAMVV